MSQSGPNKKIANRLVVLSSAAVLTVYAAGYVRTQTAADRLTERVSKGRPAPQPVPDASGLVDAVAPLPAPTASREPSPSKPEAAPVAKLAAPDEPAPVIAEVPAPSAPAALVPVETPVVTPVPVPAPAPVVVEPKPEPAPVKNAWRDGTFHGWGTSRHGDIQAAVVIEGGRIVSATISQCQTRYPCDYIDHLPPQVAQRQSPDVDTVSRATESADAFYFAVTSALAESLKAK
jgi:uncharacterized protein with FMN-binding domain